MAPRGAYGFRIEGLDGAAGHLVTAGSDWPLLRVQTIVGGGGEMDYPPGTGVVDEDHAELSLGTPGRVEIGREPLTVRFLTPAPLSTDAILHPYLALPAAIAGRWHGRLSLHGGAFVHAGRAWGLLGDREAGKSTTLAELMRRGLPVLTDDVLVCHDGELYAGPRSIDLRFGANEVTAGEPLGVVGNRERWRLRPAEGPAQIALGGFVHLRWGAALTLAPIEARERLTGLALSAALRPAGSDAVTLLDLAALPALALTRPQSPAGLRASVDRLLAGLTAQHPPTEAD